MTIFVFSNPPDKLNAFRRSIVQCRSDCSCSISIFPTRTFTPTVGWWNIDAIDLLNAMEKLASSALSVTCPCRLRDCGVAPLCQDTPLRHSTARRNAAVLLRPRRIERQGHRNGPVRREFNLSLLCNRRCLRSWSAFSRRAPRGPVAVAGSMKEACEFQDSLMLSP